MQNRLRHNSRNGCSQGIDLPDNYLEYKCAHGRPPLVLEGLRIITELGSGMSLSSRGIICPLFVVKIQLLQPWHNVHPQAKTLINIYAKVSHSAK